ETGTLEPVSWHEAQSKLAERIAAVGRANPESVRFLTSAHASHEELFVLRRLVDELIGARGAREDGESKTVDHVAVGWRRREKPQPPGAKFHVPPVDAPNVNGARIAGFVAGQVGDEVGDADISRLKADVEAGRAAALYVFDPGPEGSLGDTQWIVDARLNGTLPLLIVHGVLLTPLARHADFVLAGASYVEKEASYTNGQGRLQATARVIPPPGEAMEDWQIFVNLGVLLGVAFDYTDAAHVRADIAARYGDRPGIAGITTLAF